MAEPQGHRRDADQLRGPHRRRRHQRGGTGRRGGTVYLGGGSDFEYHGDAEKTAASRHPEGWTTLGDVGRVDEDGFLYLTDRKAYMIITGGVNVYPQEAENVLTMHDTVLDVAVIGIPDDEFGEAVKAVVQPVEMPVDEAAASELARVLIGYCRERLADVKCPPLGRLQRRAAPSPDGQALQATAPRRVLGRPRHRDLRPSSEPDLS